MFHKRVFRAIQKGLLIKSFISMIIIYVEIANYEKFETISVNGFIFIHFKFAVRTFKCAFLHINQNISSSEYIAIPRMRG